MFGNGERIDTLSEMHLKLHSEFLALRYVTTTMLSMMSFEVRNELIMQISPYMYQHPDSEDSHFERALEDILEQLRHP